VVRAPRFGRDLPPELVDDAARALIDLAHAVGALRLHVEIFEPDSFARERLMARFRRAGFKPSPVTRSYERTILIDLAGTEEELLASFHSTCRQNIRVFARRALECHPIIDESLAPRMDELSRSAMFRTGGAYAALDWPALIRFARDEPSRASFIGVFRGAQRDAAALIGFVLGIRHDDVVEYAEAASARPPDLRAPILYAPAWELMRWGMGHGARWFDFGGVSGSRGHELIDRTAGIARFKRYFKASATRVGSELVFAPQTGLDAAARLASASIGAVRRLA
jgi:hypothetical protein